MHDYIETLELPADALRQYINARQVFTALREVRAAARPYRGGMIWREQNGKNYLVRTSPNAAQKGMGVRSADTEAIYTAFVTRKTALESKRASLVQALSMQQRLNKALFVGRVDNIIVATLNALHDAGLDDSLTVIGTNALYAYEAKAGVRIEERHLATNDLDLLWDNRRRLRLAARQELSERGLLGVLKRIDKTFALRADQPYTAVNQDGFEVDVLRRLGPGSEGEPAQLSGHADDFWAVKARNADWLLSAPRFRQMIVSSTGQMAEMVTVDPRAFVLFKLWMAQEHGRDPLKRTRDANQARVVLRLIDERVPDLSFADVNIFPADVIKLLPAAAAT